MSALRPGTLCVIVGGCPENIGLVVEVIEHIGAYEDRAIRLEPSKIFTQRLPAEIGLCTLPQFATQPNI